MDCLPIAIECRVDPGRSDVGRQPSQRMTVQFLSWRCAVCKARSAGNFIAPGGQPGDFGIRPKGQASRGGCAGPGPPGCHPRLIVCRPSEPGERQGPDSKLQTSGDTTDKHLNKKP